MTDKKKLVLFSCLYALFYAFIPVCVVGYYYGFFNVETEAKVKINGIFLITLLILTATCAKKIFMWLNEKLSNKIKTFLKLLIGIGITIGLVLLLEIGRDKIDILQNAILLSGISISVSNVIKIYIYTVKARLDKEKDFQDFKGKMDRYKA